MKTLRKPFGKLLGPAVLLVIIAIIFIPKLTSAHEVYVLDHAQIDKALTTHSPNPFSTIPAQEKEFILWGILSAIVVLAVLALSVSKLFEKVFDPFLLRLKKFAPAICRITLGASLFASGFYGALFGPELPLSSFLTESVQINAVSIFLMASGFCIAIGLMTRLFALLNIFLFAYAASVYHLYMFMYADYLGAMVFLILSGNHAWSARNFFHVSKNTKKVMGGMLSKLEPYSFLILRVALGLAIFSASFYAKFWNSNLALETVNTYHLTNYFHFTPLFLVLGAFIIEATCGICLAIGFEIRFIVLFLAVFMTQSLVFFGESLWPHIILFGLALAVFFHGYDKYTLEMAIFQRKRKGEPVL